MVGANCYPKLYPKAVRNKDCFGRWRANLHGALWRWKNEAWEQCQHFDRGFDGADIEHTKILVIWSPETFPKSFSSFLWRILNDVKFQCSIPWPTKEQFEVNQLAWAFRRAFDEQLVGGGGNSWWHGSRQELPLRRRLTLLWFPSFGSSFLVLFKSFLFGLFEFGLFGLSEFGLVCSFIRKNSLIGSFFPTFLPSLPRYKHAWQVVAVRIALQD